MDLICKFVFKNGKSFGESIDIYKNYLIVKVGADFIGIPKDCIQKVELDKIVVSDFDENAALEVGKKWIEEKSKPVSIQELKSYGFGEEY